MLLPAVRAHYELQLQQKQALLTAYNTALTALASGVQSYTLNTGQTTQQVTKSSVGQLWAIVKQLDRDIVDLLTLLDTTGESGARTFIARPGF
jgi:hypothetical protein